MDLMMLPSKMATVVLSIAFGVAVLASSASAQTTDPATLHIGNGVTGTNPTGAGNAGGGSFLFNSNLTGPGSSTSGEVNAYTGQLDVFQQSNGQAAALTSPIMLIFAVPNGTSTSLSLSSVSNATLFDPFTAATGTSLTTTFGTTAFGLNNSGFEGSMSATCGSDPNCDPYTFLSQIPGADSLLSSADNSPNFANLAKADANLSAVTGGADANITATSFAIFVYGFTLPTGTLFNPNDAINVALTNVPTGSFAFGYGEANNGSGNPNPFATAFTQSGLETQKPGGGGGQGVPEPGSLVLLGSALAGLGILGRRRRRS